MLTTTRVTVGLWQGSLSGYDKGHCRDVTGVTAGRWQGSRSGFIRQSRDTLTQYTNMTSPRNFFCTTNNKKSVTFGAIIVTALTCSVPVHLIRWSRNITVNAFFIRNLFIRNWYILSIRLACSSSQPDCRTLRMPKSHLKSVFHLSRASQIGKEL